jgi:PAS domain S-box-containing protein
MDGLELIHRLHELSELTEVVVLTGNASLDSALEALRQQTFDYLTKPVQPAQLLDTLEKATERWRRKLAETALGESEERLRHMFQAIADAVFITDDSGLIVDANPAALTLTGYDLENLRSVRIEDLLDVPGDREASEGLLVPQGPLFAPGEYVLSTRDGRSLTVEIRTASFSPDRYVHTARDQTERHRLEEQVRRAQRMEAVGQLAGGLAHDFNNVLTAITGYAELLSWEFPADSPTGEHISEILQAAQRAGRLTKELLTFGRRQIFVPKVLDANDIVSGLRPMLRRLVRENIALEIELGTEVGCVRADRGRMEQVLVNLVVNAGDAMPDGGRLVVRTGGADVDTAAAETLYFGLEPGRYVTVAVEDTGVGMEPETIDQIFQPFFTTKALGKGTGLGLSTTYGIVKQSHGHIHVESTPGSGSRFEIFLPFVDGEPEAVRDEVAGAISPTGTETVLVAEDDPTVRMFIRRALDLHGYTVLSADGSESALRIAREHGDPIHLLISDLVMPGLGGPELARELAKLHPEVKTILTTGYSREAVDADALQGLDRFLEKPFRMEVLLQEVRRALDPEPA